MIPNTISHLYPQAHNHGARHRYRFVVMVLGRSGLGKSTFVDSLFAHNFQREPIDKNATSPYIRTVTQDMEERGVNLKLTVVDTPGYGDFIDNTGAHNCAKAYVQSQFKRFLSQEMAPKRGRVSDTRVHACIYFISPNARGLSPLDIATMTSLQDMVNIIPVIGKSDTLTVDERHSLKLAISRDLQRAGIRPFDPYEFVLPADDSDDDSADESQSVAANEANGGEKEDYKQHIPFAITSSRDKYELNGRTVRGRKYEWGMVEMDNESHSDFIHLRNLILRQHMNDLITTTNYIHYEKYRELVLSKALGKSTISTPAPTPQKRAMVRSGNE
ncbi:hypothetical protein SARC_01185 [Sphaeroforma arctica JP610]|uniref:Septin-type G domain-containing protein n=1 Tax=Sphaeroforma arctica JP610 TaxID=667725 RepID=A0A0L0GCP7_9EUKA|nr:hypothetical protein SARC_01185 [Sphaeroforma arctica JP610]KNC86679.1 hypothetical protein SARC_01185 [Sphaeroforma arctica JP610]|eukprot:XP_014160581.1 hypothetical protein SARC_01185 [Sphaeroforma arctica JP610]